MPLAGDLIVVEGPTGIGKTALGIALAERFGGEIISADSRQIYRGMDIGTAKATTAERARVPHHLIDMVDPDQTITLTEYQALAYAALEGIRERGRLPLLVGGTGQYITAVIEGWQAPEVPPDPFTRADLQAYADQFGYEALYARLLEHDPGAAAFVDARNVRRVIRALEVTLATGRPFSEQRRKDAPPFRTLEIALTMDRTALNERTDRRIDQMMADGLLAEVENLAARGYDWRLPSMSGLGYAQLGAYVRGEASLEDAVAEFKRANWTFVKRQYTWFKKHGAPRWFDVTECSTADIIGVVEAWRGG